MNKIVGTCSICGGDVVVPVIWHGVVPPTPQCVSCHAVAEDQNKKRVIPMRPMLGERVLNERDDEWGS